MRLANSLLGGGRKRLAFLLRLLHTSLEALGVHLKSAGVEGRFSHPLTSVRDIGRACGSACLGELLFLFNLCVSMVVGIQL